MNSLNYGTVASILLVTKALKGIQQREIFENIRHVEIGL